MKQIEKKHVHFLVPFLVCLAMLVYARTVGLGQIADLVYNLFMVLYCVWFVRTDYGSELLSTSKETTGRSILHQVLHGVGYGAAFAIVEIAALSLLFGWRPELQSYSIPAILWFVVARAISTSGEEAFFRYYFYETLRSFRVPVLASVLVISLLYGAILLVTQQSLPLSIVAVIFSAFLFWLRLSRQKESFLTLTACHFIFNLFSLYIFLTVPA